MTGKLRAVRLLGLCAVISLGGCFSLARDEPIQRHYVLGGGPAEQANQAASGELEGVTVGLRRLQLATYLEVPFIVVRRGPNQISFSEFHRWGEDLNGGINRAVARNLAARTALRGIDVAPFPARERYDYLIQLNVLRFEGVAPEEPLERVGEVHMLVTWEILHQLDGAVLARGTTDYLVPDWTVGDYIGLVNLLDMGLHSLADDLVASLVELGQT